MRRGKKPTRSVQIVKTVKLFGTVTPEAVTRVQEKARKCWGEWKRKIESEVNHAWCDQVKCQTCNQLIDCSLVDGRIFIPIGTSVHAYDHTPGEEPRSDVVEFICSVCTPKAPKGR